MTDIEGIDATFVHADDVYNAMLQTHLNWTQDLVNYIRLTEEEIDGDVSPVVLLGSSASHVTAALTNSALQFRYHPEGETDQYEVVAYIMADENGVGKLYIEKAVVLKEIEFGHWRIFERESGNMAFKWTGA